jgi:hypothetical protein
MSRKHDEHWQSICGQRQAKGFLKKPSAKRSWGIAQSEQKPAKNTERVANRTLSFKRTLFKLGVVNSRKYDICKQASEMASHVLCDCETLATLRFRHLGHHFMKPGDFEESLCQQDTALCSRCRTTE